MSTRSLQLCESAEDEVTRTRGTCDLCRLTLCIDGDRP